MKKTTTSQRLKEIMAERGLKQVDILELSQPYCKRFGVKLNKTDLSQYVSGKVEPGQHKLTILGQALNVSEAWLMGYDVAKLPSINFDNTINESQELTVENALDALDQTNTLLRKASIELSEIDHINKYRALDAYGKQAVDSILEIEYNRCTSNVEPEEKTIEIKHSCYKVSAGSGVTLGSGDDWETISIPDTPEARKADYALTIYGNSMEPVYFDGDIVLIKAQEAIDIGEIGIYTINGEGYIKKYGGDRLISLNANYDDIFFDDNDTVKCRGKVIGRI